MTQTFKTTQYIGVGVVLFILGLAGILSMLTMDIPIPSEAEALLKNKFTTREIKWLLLINPTVMLIVAVVTGTILYHRSGFQIPLIERLFGIYKVPFHAVDLFKYGLMGGVVSGILLSLTALVFEPLLPSEFLALGEQLKPSLAARFLYGGFTEEILLRFGLMTFIVWILSQFLSLRPALYWFGLILAGILFAFAHFPIAYQAVENPSILLLTYILVGNTIGGVIFGWLYWKKGLEASIIAHVVTHVVMLTAVAVFG